MRCDVIPDKIMSEKTEKKTVARTNVEEVIKQKITDISLESIWRPSIISKFNNDGTTSDILLTRFRVILNKITPEMFDTLMEEIKGLKIHSSDSLQAANIADLFFENIHNMQPELLVVYAQLCRKLPEIIGISFKYSLVSKCQREFENYVMVADEKIAEILQPLLRKILETTDLKKKIEYQMNYEDEKLKLRLRAVNSVCFFGYLFNMEILLTTIIMSCIASLLEKNSEVKLECLCNLLTIIGARLENGVYYYIQSDWTRYFKTLKEFVEETSHDFKISNRVRFMIQNVIDLQQNRWVPRPLCDDIKKITEAFKTNKKFQFPTKKRPVTKAEKQALANLVEKEPIIWDLNNVLHRNAAAVAAAWHRIEIKLPDRGVLQWKHIWTDMKSAFGNALRNQNDITDWEFYICMSFVLPELTSRYRRCRGSSRTTAIGSTMIETSKEVLNVQSAENVSLKSPMSLDSSINTNVNSYASDERNMSTSQSNASVGMKKTSGSVTSISTSKTEFSIRQNEERNQVRKGLVFGRIWRKLDKMFEQMSDDDTAHLDLIYTQLATDKLLK